MKMKTKKLIKNWSYWIGIGIVISTHIAILSMGLHQDLLGGHAFINLLAVGLILIERFWK